MAAKHDFRADHVTSSCTLIIGEERLKVSSEILAMHSHFFRSLFFAPAEKKAEGDQAGQGSAEGDDTPELVRTPLTDVRLDNVKVEEFIELLNIIYPSDSPITDENVKYVLELADKYHFNVVVYECEQFLKTGSKMSKVDRLLLADRYRLSELADEVIKGLSKEEQQQLVTAQLSSRTTQALLKLAFAAT